MISLLHGTVFDIGQKYVTIMTASGVGYAVVPGGQLLSHLVKGETAQITIFTVVKEDSITLYGFQTESEKSLFEKLISVSGIGPKAGMGLLTMPTDQFATAVEQGDIAFITRAPGIGKKTAQRLIIELAGKLSMEPTTYKNAKPRNYTDAIAALESLGYPKSIIEEVLETADKKSDSETLIRFFLSSNA